MYYAKKNEEYIISYISFLKSTKKYIDFFILIFTSTGVISWMSENEHSKIVVGFCLFAVGILQVIEIIQTKFIASDEYIDNLRDLKSRWTTYFDDLENIWIDMKVNKINNIESANIFQSLKPYRQSIENIDSDIKIWKIFHINKKTDLLTTKFMKRYYE